MCPSVFLLRFYPDLLLCIPVYLDAYSSTLTCANVSQRICHMYPGVCWCVDGCVSPAECRLGRQRHRLGAEWSPNLGPPFGVWSCIKCSCDQVSLPSIPPSPIPDYDRSNNMLVPFPSPSQYIHTTRSPDLTFG